MPAESGLTHRVFLSEGRAWADTSNNRSVPLTALDAAVLVLMTHEATTVQPEIDPATMRRAAGVAFQRLEDRRLSRHFEGMTEESYLRAFPGIAALYERIERTLNTDNNIKKGKNR